MTGPIPVTPLRARARVSDKCGRVTGEEREFLKAGFGARLRALRLGSGLSQPGLAGKAGVSAALVCMLEHGKRRPGRITVAAFAAVLNPQNAKAVGQELSALAGGSLRQGWKRATPPTERGLTLEQARRALDRARADRDLARKVRRFRPSAASDAHFARADAAVKDAQMDLRRAETLAMIGRHDVQAGEVCPHVS